MSRSKHALFEAVLARISLGSVPMDGIFWFDPKGSGRPGGRPEADAASKPARAASDAVAATDAHARIAPAKGEI
jgi:hypothetical protein